MKVAARLVLLGALSVTPATLAVASSGSPPPAPTVALGHLAVVQAVPDALVDVTIDGRSVRRQVHTGKVLGPYNLTPGEHRVEFVGSSGVQLSTTVELAAGASQDLVLHLPASVGGLAVVNTYRTPMQAIGPGKARVLVAHTATVAPADVRVDDQVIFSNIANGEYATADVPAGHHVVELLPTGEKNDPILGPLDVTLEPQTVTMVYAVGDPNTDSMGLVVHVARLTADGALVPETIDTGSAGLAARILVHTFDPAHVTDLP